MNILDKIVAVKREEVARLRPQAASLKQAAAARKDFRDFAAALHRRDGVALIAEVKKASPSAGVICADFDPVGVAREYERGGATALSVLTDEKFFQGSIEYLQTIRAAVKLPLLRKDFIIDEVQVYESIACGADAVLLIAAILDDAKLHQLITLAGSKKLAALVEVHDEVELERSLRACATIIGINNRDLRTFAVNLATTDAIAKHIGRGRFRPLVVAESGIHVRADVERVAQAGVDAILVGESLMKSGDIAAKVKELMGG